MSPSRPLPVIPPRWPDEACGSWITRVADVYGLNALELINYATGHDCPLPMARPLPTLESLIPALPVKQVAQILRLDDDANNILITAPHGWIIEDPADTSVCPLCWTADIAGGHVPYPRSTWLQAWRVLCPIHGCLLDSLAAMRQRKHKPAPRPALRSTRIRSNQQYLHRRANRSPAQKLDIADALGAIREIEHTTTRALRGIPPNPQLWGPIDAAGFTTVLRDVVIFLLTNFSERRLPPLASFDLNRVVDPGPVRCFAPSPRYFWPKRCKLGALRTLAMIADPAARRASLFWARELMHFHSVRRWLPLINRTARTKRQAAILRRQNTEGLAWLNERTHDWPADYRKRWWGGFAILELL
jgi:hypothetical protein